MYMAVGACTIRLKCGCVYYSTVVWGGSTLSTRRVCPAHRQLLLHDVEYCCIQLINFNDGMGGGNEVVSNLLFNSCRDSGDHGPFNVSDRGTYAATH
jgi:hypothetical protein